jgi:DNA invertase Pin-like site-specific DNA recombinase
MVFSVVSEIERDLISKRTSESLKTRNTASAKPGRLKGLDIAQAPMSFLCML